MKRNYTLDVIKLAMAVSIALGHWGVEVVASGMLVNCFFTISGYFLAQSSWAGKYEGSSFLYTKSRVKRIYPYYLAAFVLLVAYRLVGTWAAGEALLPKFFSILEKSLPELTMVQSIGIFDECRNYPTWQISTLIVGGYLLFGLMSWNPKLTTNVLCPVLAILGMSYFSNAYETHTVEKWALLGNCVSASLFRAMSFLSLGIAVCPIFQYALGRLQSDRVRPWQITAIGLCFGWYYWRHNGDMQGVLAFVGILACVLSGKGLLAPLLDRPWLKWCEKLSLSIYVNHAFLINVYRDLFGDRVTYQGSIPFLAFLIPCCVVFCVVMEMGSRMLRKRKMAKKESAVAERF